MKVAHTRSVKQVAFDLFKGNKKMKDEIEKMFGKKFENMTQEERKVGATVLAAFENYIWN